jgi:hypothetical protein
MTQPQTRDRGVSQNGAGSALPGPAAQDAIPGFAALIQSLLREAWMLAQDHILLVVLEAQRATRAVATVVIAGVVAAVLLVTAWLALVASVLCWVVLGDTPWAYALLVVGLIHVAVSVILFAWIRRVASHRIFTALMRQLHPRDRLPGDAP